MAESSKHNETAHTNETNGHGADGGGHITPDNLFPTLLGNNLGNHRDLSWLGQHITELPVIVYDSETGLSAYATPSEMVKDGEFTMKATDEHHNYKFAGAEDLREGAMHWKPPIVKTSTIQPDPKTNKMVGEPVDFDMSVSSLTVFQWIAMAILIIIFFIAGRKYKKRPKKAPSGLQNLVETMVVFVRDEIVSPNCGSDKAAKNLLSYFIGLFFFILIMNLLGLIPGGHTATSSIAVTGALAVVAYFVINITAMIESGVGTWFKHLLGGAPIALAPIMIPIEIISMFVKPFALAIRLFANMTAGHVVLFSLVGLIFFFKLSMGITYGAIIAPVSVAFSVFIYFVELLVAFIQAYIFTILTAVFVGLAIGEHPVEEDLEIEEELETETE